MDPFEGMVLDYLRADRSLFVNSLCHIQLYEEANPDTNGPLVCDVVGVIVKKQSFTCAKPSTR
ncbi:hypothetical protein ACFFJ4_22975 [Xanthomonas dyei]|uniref:hypothetical protein n=1 Tax=Xanthomonas dyei TaxID=743699 RepID=UPI0011B02026|nr:hypothetical protein [Xanthomonas dyei]